MVIACTEWTEPERILAISAGASRLLRKMAFASGEACVWSLLDVVWPGLTREVVQEAWLAKVEIALVPLARIGQIEGKSGSLVLSGRFRSTQASRPSNPLVVKTRRRSGSGTELHDEWTRALAAKPHTYDRKDSFAIPVHYDDTDRNYEVLWSLCLPTVRESEADKIDHAEFPTVKDLRNLLAPKKALEETTESHRTASLVLERTYALLRNLHRSSAAAGTSTLSRERRPLGVEYERYLRRYGTKPGSFWGPEWAAVWAPADQRNVGKGINPLWLVDRLHRHPVTMQLGLVHGDLHPGNVILREGEAPAIIDFGWSEDRVHVARDFALMECNLRFLTLQPQISAGDLEAFTSALSWDCELPSGTSGYVCQRFALVKVVRAAARRVFAPDTKWDEEYLAPLFLVAFGLLRFAPQLGNQRAALQFVESLATNLVSALQITEDVP